MRKTGINFPSLVTQIEASRTFDSFLEGFSSVAHEVAVPLPQRRVGDRTSHMSKALDTGTWKYYIVQGCTYGGVHQLSSDSSETSLEAITF